MNKSYTGFLLLVLLVFSGLLFCCVKKQHYRNNENKQEETDFANTDNVIQLNFAKSGVSFTATLGIAQGQRVEVGGAEHVQMQENGMVTITLSGETCSLVGNVKSISIIKNDELSQLRIKSTSLINAHFSFLPALQSLKLICPELQKLSCAYTSLQSLHLNQSPKLLSLSCEHSKLNELHINRCTLLRTVVCNDNYLTELNLKYCTDLQTLHCQNNRLSNLVISPLNRLRKLNYENNFLPAENVKTIIESLAKKFGTSKS
ncbi:hypothetical protein [Treponema phagedenis]|uniref:hypothetical protein n=1 Tax=Treponema phagedenis TaxID=162 RepID=UPI000463E8FE|nr:hypothetical protein [Treponema phagedenis]NVP25559.1 hypothetical protein [Treponema phagedenis]QEJ94094.1 hypothetical protein FUT79_01920 [Treponema phagedenis]QKS91442.1 hypothetical protein HPJ96_01815 [Treponema phagedenis]QLC60053.1 hypothetical protein HW453_15605 [Treponema phagedenis]QSH94277.1 hypothetical protein C5O78_04330 [Treponema phagedenis]